MLEHRPYSTGFYLGELKLGHYNDGKYRQECTFIGRVLDWNTGVAAVQQRNNFKVGDTLEVLSPGRAGLSFRVESMRDADGADRDSAPHPNEIVYVPCDVQLMPGDFLRRRDPIE